MTHEDFFAQIEAAEVLDYKIREVERCYHSPLPKVVQSILSLQLESEFVDDKRLLSVKEILSADKELGTDFVDRKLLPVFDSMDNDFIVYDLRADNWAMVNIVDLCLFGKRNSLRSYFE